VRTAAKAARAPEKYGKVRFQLLEEGTIYQMDKLDWWKGI
jgi:hypothetical protein